MNVVVISSCRPLDIFWMERVHCECPIRAVIRPEWERSPHTKSRWKKFWTKRWTTVKNSTARELYDRMGGRIDNAIGRLLFPQGHSHTVDAPVISVPAWDINSGRTAEIIQEHTPDLTIVSGAPILRANMFSIPRFGTLNVHRGISPEYRGESTIFWPLYYRDYNRIGITLHFIDEGVDTGLRVAQGYPAIRPDDTEVTLLAKCGRN